MDKPVPDPIEIKNVWRLLDIGDDSVIELRAISPTGTPAPITKHYRAENYSHVQALKDAFECDRTS